MRPATTIILPTLLLLAACPIVGPRDETTDDGAQGSETGSAPAPSPAPSSTTGTEPRPESAAACEDELARVKAELAECRAGSSR